MSQSKSLIAVSKFSINGLAGVLLLLAVMLSIGACGSTKVYTADKTIVYNGSLYNMSNVQKISSNMIGIKNDGETINMRTLDKKGVQALFDAESSMLVKCVVTMDDQEMLYKNGKLSSYSNYSKMAGQCDSALSSINKFMANKKKTQLKLK